MHLHLGLVFVSDNWIFQRLLALVPGMRDGGTNELVLTSGTPRQRALGLDPFSDLSTACSDPQAFEWADGFSRNEMFEEVPQKILDEKNWHVAKVGLWKYPHEHITLKEARTVVLAIRRATRTASLRGKKLLLLVDNLALALMLGKGRSSNYGMLRVAQKIGALLLAGQLVL